MFVKRPGTHAQSSPLKQLRPLAKPTGISHRLVLTGARTAELLLDSFAPRKGQLTFF